MPRRRRSMNVVGKVLSPWLPLADTAERVEFALRYFLAMGMLLDPLIERQALRDGVEFLHTAAQGRDIVKSSRFLGAPVDVVQTYGKVLTTFERLYKQGREEVEKQDLKPLIERYENALISILDQAERQTTVPDDDTLKNQHLEEARKFFQALRDVAFEKLSRPADRVVGW
jgi:hypothetical protein